MSNVILYETFATVDDFDACRSEQEFNDLLQTAVGRANLRMKGAGQAPWEVVMCALMSLNKRAWRESDASEITQAAAADGHVQDRQGPQESER